MDIDSFDFGAEVSEAFSHIKVWPRDGELTCLVDGDLLPYIIGYAYPEICWFRAQNRVERGTCYSLEDTPEFEEVKQKLCMTMNGWIEGAKADSAVIYMTDSAKNFRLQLAVQKPYKGTRKAEKPPFFYELRNFMIAELGAILSDGEEADDLLTIHVYEHQLNALIAAGIKPGSKQHQEVARFVIASKDKDLSISPGWHYSIADQKTNWVDQIGELLPQWGQTPKGKTNIKKLRGTGLKFFYSQLLQGDSVDNYSGIPRMKLMDIYDLLEPCTTERELYEATLSAYVNKYSREGCYISNFRGGGRIMKPHEIMHEQGRLAHMQRFRGEIWRSEKVPVLRGDDESLWN